MIIIENHDIIAHVRFGTSQKFRTGINSCGAYNIRIYADIISHFTLQSIKLKAHGNL